MPLSINKGDTEMTPERLAYLSRKHSAFVTVTHAEETTGSIKLTLSCGHTGECVPHVDAKTIKSWTCSKCGEEMVRSWTRYADEFE